MKKEKKIVYLLNLVGNLIYYLKIRLINNEDFDKFSLIMQL